MTATYPTTADLNTIIETASILIGERSECRESRPFRVIADGKHSTHRSLASLRRELESCYVPRTREVFKNALGGVTVNLDRR